jgi:hypothetical protein
MYHPPNVIILILLLTDAGGVARSRPASTSFISSAPAFLLLLLPSVALLPLPAPPALHAHSSTTRLTSSGGIIKDRHPWLWPFAFPLPVPRAGPSGAQSLVCPHGECQRVLLAQPVTPPSSSRGTILGMSLSARSAWPSPPSI